MPADVHSVLRGRRGFVIGELLVAVLLLAVAVSSLAALMYSVSHRPEMTPQVVACSTKSGASDQCGQRTAAGGPQLLRGTCVKNGPVVRGCDPAATRDASGETIVKSKTDSASLALVAKKEKPAPVRHNRGFVR